jgi:hypothetical protein
LLLAGLVVVAALLSPRHWIAPAQFWACVIAIVLAAIPATRRMLLGGLRAADATFVRRPLVATGIVFLVAAIYLLLTALWQERDLFPKYHDQQMYYLQAHLVAEGRLWLPPHELYAPGVWMNWPYWLGPLLVAAGAVALLYRLTGELLDGASAAVAAVALVSLTWFRHVSVIMMSHSVLVLLALGAVLAFLRWRPAILEDRPRAWGWMLLVGVLVGWAGITRPLDALTYAVPLAIAVLWTLWGRCPRTWAVTVVAGLVTVTPLLAIQLWFNHGVTGRWTQPPLDYYTEINAPGIPSYGIGSDTRFDFDPPRVSHLEQKQLFYEIFGLRQARARQAMPASQRLADFVRSFAYHGLPAPILLVLLFGGIPLLWRNVRWTLALQPPLFALAYAFYLQLLPHYVIAAAPAMILMTLCGAKIMGQKIAPVLMLLILAMSIAAMPEITGHTDDPQPVPEFRIVQEDVPRLAGPNSIVLYRFDPSVCSFHNEPVYNWDVAWPDDASVIRAHDLGERNIELYRYYAERQPTRKIYRFDRGALYRLRRGEPLPLVYLGTAAELAKQ